MNVIARFEPEIALDPLLKTYSGGLGVLAGSVARTAKRMNAPLVSVTILWNKGFYEQSIGPHGMEISYPCYDYYKEGIVDDTGIKVKVQIGENPNVLIKVATCRCCVCSSTTYSPSRTFSPIYIRTKSTIDGFVFRIPSRLWKHKATHQQ